MNLLKAIIFIGCALQLAHCGGQGSSAKEVKVARVENGVPKAEDGRVILSSESETLLPGDRLVIPHGEAEGVTISKQKLESYITNKFDDVSEITIVSFLNTLYVWMVTKQGRVDAPKLRFNIRDKDGFFYEDVHCFAVSTSTELILHSCGNSEVKLNEDRIVVSISDII